MVVTVRFDERQAKSLPEKIGDFHCFLTEATATARTLPHLYKLRFACDRMTRVMIDGRHNVGGNHQERDGCLCQFIIQVGS